MDQVYQKLGIEDTYKDTVRSINVTSVNDTQVMEISVVSTDPYTALDVCREITVVAPDVIVDAVEAGSVKVVQQASTTYKKVSPNVSRNTVIAALIGILIAIAVIAIQLISDNKISSEKDLEQLDLTLLGVIPSYDEGEK